MKLKMKTQVCSNEKFYKFIKDSVMSTKEFIKTIKLPCAICEAEVLVDDISDCQICGKSICPDHAVIRGQGSDEYYIVCTECIERKHDKI